MVAKLTLPMTSVPHSNGPSSLPPSAQTTSHCSPWLTPLAYFLCRRWVLPAYFGRIFVSGQDNLPTRGPVILAPTHRSRWDSLLLPWAVGRPVTGRDLHYMVTADEVTGIQGWFIRRLGGFAVNTRCPSISSLRHGIDLLQAGHMLVIFPEGDIFRDGSVHRLKPGLARLAVQAESLHPSLDTKIVPVSFDYSDPHVGWRTDVDVLIGPPLTVADYLQQAGPDHLKAAAKHLTADLTQAITTLATAQQQYPHHRRPQAMVEDRSPGTIAPSR
jgi:1-acyl-sn-glycerol-3-phosphate acyltransferase